MRPHCHFIGRGWFRAQGFSIGVKNGQVTALFRNSTLNAPSANYNLQAQTASQILQSLGATGAKVFGSQ